MNILDQATRVIRAFSLLIAKFLDNISKSRIRPDHLTWVGLIAHIPVAFLIYNGHLIAAAILIMVFGLLDSVDGSLARLQKSAREAGMILDAVTDRVKQVLIYVGIVGYIYVNDLNSLQLFVAVFAMGMIITTPYLKAKTEVALAYKKKFTSHHELNYALSDGILKYEYFTVLIIVGLLSNTLFLANSIIAILATSTIAYRLITIDEFVAKNSK